LLLDGKAVCASYNNGVKERFVHLSHVKENKQNLRERFIIGVRATVKDRNGEWGASVSLLDSLGPIPEDVRFLISGDAGFSVEQNVNFLKKRGFYYLFRLKQNAGGVFTKVKAVSKQEVLKRPEGDFVDSSRISGSSIHKRKLWRCKNFSFQSYQGVKEAFVIEKTNLKTGENILQYYLTNYPSPLWKSDEILQRILLHWDTETGIFGTKDNYFLEDSVRYKSLDGTIAHVALLNFVCNFYWAPLFQPYWEGKPISHRVQFFKDHPKYNPMMDTS